LIKPPGVALDTGLVEDTGDALERLIASDEIRQLVYRYALAVDSRDLDTLVELFVHDVRVGAEQGREALRRSFDQMLRSVGVTILNVGNHIIDFEDGDQARGIVYCRAEIEVGDRWVVQAIQYRDLYARRAGRWYFVRRRHLLWYGADMLERPIGLPPANWPESPIGKGELPDAWPTWKSFWETDG
jgi:ketosteroid isomerase-like protein